VRSRQGELTPKLVEIQAFPSIYGYQSALCSAYREAFGLPGSLGAYLGGLSEEGYWELLGRTILGGHAPENVALTEVDPLHQKTRPDFEVTARRRHCGGGLSSIEAVDNKLHYRNSGGRLVPIHRIITGPSPTN